MALDVHAVSYVHEGITFDGAVYAPDAGNGTRHGVLLVHGGAGLDEHAHEQARRWASTGHVVLACDMYGRGVADDRARVMATVTRLRDDPDEVAGRAGAALETLRPHTDGGVAAVGYCFGGLVTLTLARAGLPLAACVSIHGSLATTRRARQGGVRSRVLACHGSADPHVPLEHVVGFAREMDDAGASWRLTMYGGAQHGFTHRHAVPGESPGVAYDAGADAASFADASGFLAAAFG
jgi:dienelactone hydrolase